MEIRTKTKKIATEIFDSTDNLGNSCRMDMRSKEQKKAMNPVEILLSAVSSCAAVDLDSFLTKRKRTISNLVVEAKGTRATDHPRRFTDIHLTFKIESPDVEQKEFEKYASLAIDYCSVGKSLSSNLTWECLLNKQA